MQENWERQVLNDLLQAGLKEQRRKRRWGIFFKLLGFGYLTLMIVLLVGGSTYNVENASVGPHTAIVKMEGVIAANGEVNTRMVLDSLEQAFENKNTRGIILSVNSPGGSPVEAGQLHDEMLRLKQKHPQTPLYVVIGDICASGCYYAAVAADKIYADKASIVGSIGVLMDGFGFTGAMDKLGIERRLLTAGKNKSFLDPFSPVSDEQKAKAQDMLGEIHQQFIDVVKAGRGKRLGNDPDLFTGLVWSGAKSVNLGLIDGLGSVGSVARDVVKVDNVVDFTSQPGYLDRFARRMGIAAATHLGSQLLLHLSLQ